jgi:hypothetical protein
MSSSSKGNSLLDAELHRSNQIKFLRRAETTTSPEERAHFLQMARTSQLLAKNADWMNSTRDFLAWWRT